MYIYRFIRIINLTMTLAQLRHFIVLAEVGSYTKAAARLFLTQSALSRSIAGLEDELGQLLFDRIGRRIELTRFGETVLTRAQRLLHEADDLINIGAALSLGESGSIKLGMSSGPGAVLTVPLLLAMTRQHPRLRIEVARGNTDLLIHALRSQRLDAVIVDIRSLRPAPDLSITHQVELSASFMCRKDHPLAAQPAPVSFDALRAYPIASTPLSDEVARILTELYGPAANPEEMVTLRCDEIHSLVEVARDSDAILLTIDAAATDLHHLEVTPRMSATARFGLVTLSDRSATPALGLVAEMMKQLLPG